MELKELTEKTLVLFGVESVENLGGELLQACADEKTLNAFVDMVNGDLSRDWLQAIYQYNLADRKEKKQDYTPLCLARFMGLLAGNSKRITDLCAGSGALIIQKWVISPDTKFHAVELDDSVIPFLLFNMVVRNIECNVVKMNAIESDRPDHEWRVRKGERFGRLIDIKPTV